MPVFMYDKHGECVVRTLEKVRLFVFVCEGGGGGGGEESEIYSQRRRDADGGEGG